MFEHVWQGSPWMEELSSRLEERAGRVWAPTLVIGLGGTGSDLALAVKQAFARRLVLSRDMGGQPRPLPDKTAFLSIDTEPGKAGFDESEYLFLKDPGLREDLHTRKLGEDEKAWINPALSANEPSRQLSRLLLSRNYPVLSRALENKLRQITTVSSPQENGGRMEIAVITGLGGFTGSGIFLDIAQIVRHIMASSAGLQGQWYRLSGYLVLPDVTLPLVGDNPAMIRIQLANAYAALKELDFWMRVSEHHTPYAVRYTDSAPISWYHQPFSPCVLMGLPAGGCTREEALSRIRDALVLKLLHGQTAPVEQDSSKGEAGYTLGSLMDNLYYLESQMDKRLPVFYGYRTMGSASLMIPRRRMLGYEGTLLFSALMPPRDAQGSPLPAPAFPEEDGGQEQAREIAGNLFEQYETFKALIQLPDDDEEDSSQLEANPNLDYALPPPHRQPGTNSREHLTEKAQNYLDAHGLNRLRSAWVRFERIADQVITDPGRGPFSLLHSLTGPWGNLLASLTRVQGEWWNQQANIRNIIGMRYYDCEERWRKRTTLIFRSSRFSVDRYREALHAFYEAKRQLLFVEQAVQQLEALIQRVVDYRDTSLALLCRDLLAAEGELRRLPAHPGDPDAMELAGLEDVKGQLDSAFTRCNAEGKAVRAFFGALSRASLRAQEEADGQGKELAFAYKEHGRTLFLEALGDSLEDCFGALNRQPLDDYLADRAEDGQEGQEEGRETSVDQVADEVLQGAVPAFMVRRVFAFEETWKFKVLFVPYNAPAFAARARQQLPGQEIAIINSPLTEGVSALSLQGNLALYQHHLLRQMEEAYLELMELRGNTLHLVCRDTDGMKYDSNWFLLPSPAPFYYFGSSGGKAMGWRYAQARELARRARDCGMLQVDSSTPAPLIRLRVFYRDVTRTEILDGHGMTAQMERLDLEAFAGQALPEDARARLMDYLSGAQTVRLMDGRKATVMADYLNLRNEPIDPFDILVRGNPAALEKAEKNHILLCEELSCAALCQHPQMLEAVREQVAGFEQAAKALAGIGQGSKPENRGE